MYLLDTNVVSELRKAKTGKADRHVIVWANAVQASSLFLSAITILELELGVLLVERRDPVQGGVLRSWLDTHVLPAFAGRVLPIDIEVARRCALLHMPDPRAERDALIAATALVHGMAVVTRNADDFAATGVRIINPWKPQRAQISAIGINLFRSPVRRIVRSGPMPTLRPPCARLSYGPSRKQS
jgi:predicted nucleic acid-binding protein